MKHFLNVVADNITRITSFIGINCPEIARYEIQCISHAYVDEDAEQIRYATERFAVDIATTRFHYSMLEEIVECINNIRNAHAELLNR